MNAGKPGTRPDFALDDYVGEYEHPGYGAMHIVRQGGALAMSSTANSRVCGPNWHRR